MQSLRRRAKLYLLLALTGICFIGCAGTSIMFRYSWTGILTMFGCFAMTGAILFLTGKLERLQTAIWKAKVKEELRADVLRCINSELRKSRDNHFGDSQ